MINAEMMQEAEQRRLAWRCRRGMLELDIMLQHFVKQHFTGLTLDEMQHFDALLDFPDNELLDLIQGTKMSSHPSLQQLIHKLKHSMATQKEVV